MLTCRNRLQSSFSTAPCYGQVNVGRITGTITDEAGAVVPRVTVNPEELSSETGIETVSRWVAPGDRAYSKGAVDGTGAYHQTTMLTDLLHLTELR